MAILLAAASVGAQDGGPTGQPPSEAPSVGGPWCQGPCGPSFAFEADWLFQTRAKTTAETRNFIDGPDAAGFNDLPAVTGDNGYRLRGEARLGCWVLEGVYSDFGGWNSWLNRNVDGVAFNASGVTGDWAGRNYINAGTYFTPIFNAASVTTGPVITANDQSGLGPSTSFASDPRPALMAYLHSDFHMAEANVKWADYFIPAGGRGLRLGAGYVNADLNQDGWVALSGTFRAVSNVGAATVNLPGSVLTAPGGGNLTFYSGGGSGFNDGTSNGTGIPSQLLFIHHATTSNNLNGAQFVLDGDLLDFWRIDIGGTLKAGLCDNFAEGNIVETYKATNNDQSNYTRVFSDSHHHAAFLGGVGVSAGYHITDEVSIRGGYEVLFLTNMALSEEQVNGISSTNQYHVQTNGTATIQSGHLGVEIAF